MWLMVKVKITDCLLCILQVYQMVNKKHTERCNLVQLWNETITYNYVHTKKLSANLIYRRVHGHINMFVQGLIFLVYEAKKTEMSIT